MRKLFYALVFVLISLSCSKEESEENVQKTIENQWVSVNPHDNLIFRRINEDNTIVEFFGEKDASGKALGVTFVEVEYVELGETVLIEIDELGRPSASHSSEGTFKFNYNANGEVRITALYNEGKNKLLFSPEELTSGTSNKLQETTRGIRKTSLVKNANHYKDHNSSECLPNSNFKISAEKCGEPFDSGIMWVSVQGVDAQWETTLKAGSDGHGNYCFVVPEPQPESNVDEICMSVEKALGKLCDGAQLINPATATTLCANLAQLSKGASMPVFAGCELLYGSISIYCATLGASATPGAPSALELICESSIVNKPSPTKFTFKPVMFLEGGGMYYGEESNPQAVNVGEFQNLSINLPDKAEIEGIATSPLDPSEGEDYSVTATVNCLSSPATAILSVVGSDEYTQEESQLLPIGNSTITLSVPGAEEGVADVITLKVEGVGESTVMIVF